MFQVFKCLEFGNITVEMTNVLNFMLQNARTLIVVLTVALTTCVAEVMIVRFDVTTEKSDVEERRDGAGEELEKEGTVGELDHPEVVLVARHVKNVRAGTNVARLVMMKVAVGVHAPPPKTSAPRPLEMSALLGVPMKLRPKAKAKVGKLSANVD